MSQDGLITLGFTSDAPISHKGAAEAVPAFRWKSWSSVGVADMGLCSWVMIGSNCFHASTSTDLVGVWANDRESLR
jgi:hypothetical protein